MLLAHHHHQAAKDPFSYLEGNRKMGLEAVFPDYGVYLYCMNNRRVAEIVLADDRLPQVQHLARNALSGLHPNAAEGLAQGAAGGADIYLLRVLVQQG